VNALRLTPKNMANAAETRLEANVLTKAVEVVGEEPRGDRPEMTGNEPEAWHEVSGNVLYLMLVGLVELNAKLPADNGNNESISTFPFTTKA
jgi:hypothetical protein